MHISSWVSDCEAFGSNTFGKYCFIKRKECSEITNSSLTLSERFVNRENQKCQL